MTYIASGRVEFLQTGIVQAVKNLEELDNTSFLPNGIVETVFGDLLKDPVISSEIKKVKDDNT